MAKYENLCEVVPGLFLAKFARSKNIYCRVYNKDIQNYLNRSTGKVEVDQARQWVLQNLQSLYQLQPAPRGGGSNSVKRLLVEHVEFLRKRQEAGEISKATFINYERSSRHFTEWFLSNGMRKLSDIKRNSMSEYGLDRVNKDKMSPNTVNLEVVYLRMWWKWMQDEEIIDRPLRVHSVKKAIENRIGGEPFSQGHLDTLYATIKEWKKEKSGNNFGKNSVSKFNKELFHLFIQLLDESGCRQHEIWNRKWSEIKIGETRTDRKRIINTIAVPQQAKRGARQCVFRGDALIKIKELQKKMCPNPSNDDYIFRTHQTNNLIDLSTFSRYWTTIRKKCDLSYPLHTFRSHRITQLIMSGVEAQLVARNLGLSLKQIESSYLRFTPAGHFDKLVQRELPVDSELRSLM